MRSFRRSRLALLAGLVCLVLPAHADAQIGGFLKKKIKQAVKGDSAEAAAQKGGPGAAKAAPAGPTFDEYVLQLSSQNLDRLERAAAGEKAFRDSVLAVRAKLMTPQQYGQCRYKAMGSPEAQALAANPPKDAAAFQKYNSAFEALIQKRCGANPNTFKEEDLSPGEAIGARAAGLTTQQFSIMKERVVPFCRAGGAAKVAGATPGMFYVYAADEMAALQPRCAKLMALLGKSFDTAGNGATGATGPKFDDNVIELTPDVLSRLEKYYVTMDAYRDSMKAMAGKVRPTEEWDECGQQYMTSPEGQAIIQNMARSGQPVNPQTMGATIKTALEKKCGPDPHSVDRDGSRAPDFAARKAGLTSAQISMMVERIYPVCATVEAEPNKPFSAGMQRMYSPTELKALPPRCARLAPMIQKHQGAAPVQ
jgi:hypothetical protein